MWHDARGHLALRADSVWPWRLLAWLMSLGAGWVVASAHAQRALLAKSRLANTKPLVTMDLVGGHHCTAFRFRLCPLGMMIMDSMMQAKPRGSQLTQ
jgi:hypothetical protein